MSRQAVKVERAKQIRPPLERAIRLMVEEGSTLSEAAQTAGLVEESLRKALAKPHVKLFRTGVTRAWLENQASRGFVKAVTLMDGAESQKLQLESAKLLIGAAGMLEPERASTGSGSVMVQIVCAPAGPAIARPPASGVWELPPYSPGDARPVIEHPPLSDDEDDDEPED